MAAGVLCRKGVGHTDGLSVADAGLPFRGTPDDPDSLGVEGGVDPFQYFDFLYAAVGAHDELNGNRAVNLDGLRLLRIFQMGGNPGGESIGAFSLEGRILVKGRYAFQHFRMLGAVGLADQVAAGHFDGDAVIDGVATDDSKGVAGGDPHLRETHLGARAAVLEAIDISLARLVLQIENTAGVSAHFADNAVQFHQRGIAAGHLVEFVHRLADALGCGREADREGQHRKKQSFHLLFLYIKLHPFTYKRRTLRNVTRILLQIICLPDHFFLAGRKRPATEMRRSRISAIEEAREMPAPTA